MKTHLGSVEDCVKCATYFSEVNMNKYKIRMLDNNSNNSLKLMLKSNKNIK